MPAALGLVSLVTIAALLPTSRPDEERAAYGKRPDARSRFSTVLTAGTLSATGAFAGFTYIVTFLGDVSGFSPGAVSVLLVVFGVACLAGVTVTGAVLDRFPQAALSTAVTTQAVGMLGRYALGTRPVAAVVFLTLMGGALGAVFMTAQNAMLHCAPGRTDIALAADSGSYNAGIAAGAALGGLVLRLADVRGTFLAGGLLTVGACAVLMGTWVLGCGGGRAGAGQRAGVASRANVRQAAPCWGGGPGRRSANSPSRERRSHNEDLPGVSPSRTTGRRSSAREPLSSAGYSPLRPARCCSASGCCAGEPNSVGQGRVGEAARD